MNLLSKIFNIILIISSGILVMCLTTWLEGLITKKDSGGLIYIMFPSFTGLIVMTLLSLKLFKSK